MRNGNRILGRALGFESPHLSNEILITKADIIQDFTETRVTHEELWPTAPDLS